MASYHPKRFPTVPPPGVPLDQTMAPVDFEGRDENGKRPPGPLRVWLKSIIGWVFKGRPGR
jgi:hypothetical protein